jgi:dienelactone hydrolase
MHVPLCLLLALAAATGAAEIITLRPTEIDDMLVNPGIGFTTFQRFNGDRLNEGLKWTEGYPIRYQEVATGSLTNQDHPMTSIAYFRVYWQFVEPEPGAYRWELLDTALATARARGQTLMLRIAPYGTGKDNDVPAWYRALVAGQDLEKSLPEPKWRVHPENPLYLRHFGGLIRAVGARYNGHPDLELVDVSIVGAWGEGAGAERLSEATRRALLDCYLDTFRHTPLVLQLQDETATHYALAKQPVGWRVDCLGDMGGFSKTWSHMNDYYPQTLIQTGMQEAWRRAPVTMEACWVMQHWKNQGWDIDHIIDESLKWHISSFNAKSSPVPKEWWPQVNRWLKKMGYRLVLRKFTYPAVIKPGDPLAFATWWENKGVAPCYRKFPLALRLKNNQRSEILLTDTDITTWLPGDNLFDSSVPVPAAMSPGEFELEIGLLDPLSKRPKVKLAIAGCTEDGWYPLGKIRVQARAPAPKSNTVWNAIAPFFQPPPEFANQFGAYRSPLLFDYGTPVKTSADWTRRRQEIQKQWHELMGPWPPVIEQPKLEFLSQSRRDNFTQHRVRLETAPNQTGEGWLLVPDGSGPFPAVLVVYYEPETSIGLGTGPLRDFGYQLARRGFVTLNIGTPGGDARKPELGEAHCQPLSFHAYVAANCWHALANRPEVDRARIGVVGHSYGGKWAMFAAALWDEFACVAVSDPGIVFDETRPNVNYWEPWYLGFDPAQKRPKAGLPSADNPRTGAYKKMVQTGRDLPELHALIAPRPFLVSGGSEDPPERWKALNHTIAVTRLLGCTNRVAMTNRQGHTPTEESNAHLYAFFEHFLKNR